MDSITYSQAKRNLGAAMDKAAEQRAPVLIRRRCGGDVVLVSEHHWALVEQALRG